MKKYLIYLFSGLGFVLIVVASLLIYQPIYLSDKPLTNLINKEIDSISLVYFNESLNEKSIDIKDESKIDGFNDLLKDVTYHNVFSTNNLTSKEYVNIQFKDESVITLMQYYIFNNDRSLEQNIYISDQNYSAIVEYFSK